VSWRAARIDAEEEGECGEGECECGAEENPHALVFSDRPGVWGEGECGAEENRRRLTTAAARHSYSLVTACAAWYSALCWLCVGFGATQTEQHRWRGAGVKHWPLWSGK